MDLSAYAAAAPLLLCCAVQLYIEIASDTRKVHLFFAVEDDREGRVHL